MCLGLLFFLMHRLPRSTLTDPLLPYAALFLSTGVWKVLIFLNHHEQPEVSLQEFLVDFGTRFAGVSWENTDTSLYFEAHLDANWKVLADAFSETYHIPSIHPATIGKTFASAVNPHSRPLDARFWGPHRQFSTFGNPDYAP